MAPGKKVRTDVSKSGDDTTAFAAEGETRPAVTTDAVRAVSGAVMRASLGVMILSLATEAASAVAVEELSGTTKALEEQVSIEKWSRLNAAAKYPDFIVIYNLR
jgi:hypothetical protein